MVRRQKLSLSDFCTEHFSGGGVLPCAWPDCPLGIRDDQIEWEPTPGLPTAKELGLRDLGPDLDRRVRLDSVDGRERFFWKNQQFPWSMLSTQIRNHELNRVHRPLHTSKRVYHYTTLKNLQAIVESQDIWLSDYAYLNDSTEVRHGQDLARLVFQEISGSLEPSERALFTPLLDLPLDQHPRICVACFSFDRDSLSQWRGYGSNELPVAVGVVPEDLFFESGRPFQTRWSPVIYPYEGKRLMLRSLFHDWRGLYQRDREDPPNYDWEKGYEIGPLEDAFELFAMVKHESFQDERELRFVHRASFAFRGFDAYQPPKRFFVRGPIMRPYTTIKDLVALNPKLQDEESPRLPLEEVVVGPHPYAALAAAGIREFLGANGYKETVVALSTIPFR